MKNILVPIDFSKETDLIMEEAIKMAKAFSSDIYLLHIEPPVEDLNSSNVEDAETEITREFSEETSKLNDYAQRFRDENIITHAVFAEGVQVNMITEEADKISADLIIMGARIHGRVASFLFGDASQEILKTVTCPVLMIPIHD